MSTRATAATLQRRRAGRRTPGRSRPLRASGFHPRGSTKAPADAGTDSHARAALGGVKAYPHSSVAEPGAAAAAASHSHATPLLPRAASPLPAAGLSLPACPVENSPWARGASCVQPTAWGCSVAARTPTSAEMGHSLYFCADDWGFGQINPMRSESNEAPKRSRR